MVNGKKIGHFPYRRRASALIAAITGQPAHYRGLQGEEFRSDRAPQRPYPEQTRLVAAWMLGRLKRELADVNRRLKEARPVERLMWSYLRGHTLHAAHRDLCDEYQFGPPLARALKEQAERDGLLDRFKELRSLYPWNTGYFGE